MLDVQQVCVKTSPNDIFIGSAGEANILSNSEEKNLYPLLTLPLVHSLWKNQKL